jgi:hypothetical protein
MTGEEVTGAEWLRLLQDFAAATGRKRRLDLGYHAVKPSPG